MGAVLPMAWSKQLLTTAKEEQPRSVGNLPAAPAPHLRAKCSQLGKNRHKTENQVCTITYPTWAYRVALHHPPQKHTFATEITLIQAGCWSHQESSMWLLPPKCRRRGRQRTTLRLLLRRALQQPPHLAIAPSGPPRAGKPVSTATSQVPLSC